MSKRAFGELESQILFILKSGQRMTVKDVHKKLGGTNNYNTIMTVMSRLVDKQILAREKMGLHYEYWILQPTSQSSFLNKIKEKLFGVKTNMLVSHLLETADDLSKEDLEHIEDILKRLKDTKNEL